MPPRAAQPPMLPVVASIALAACHAPAQKGVQVRDGMRVADAYGDVIELDQGWTDDTQQGYYNTPQGSEIMPYAWILALEQQDREVAFLAPANIERFRYLPRKASPGNPDALPVGWTKGVDASGAAWFGLTCAACHTAQLEYTPPDGATLAIRLDGAPTLADFELMNLDLVAAMRATLAEPAKFDRFAKAVLGGGDAPSARTALRGELEAQTAALDTRNRINHAGTRYGFGRIDAIGAIFNQVMSTLPGIPENAMPADAPASYPFLWGTDQSSAVQWTGFAANEDGAGTLVRNGGEVIGVYGKVTLTTSTSYASSLLIDNLGVLENWVRELDAPAWPEAVLPPIDRAKAARGEALYAGACAGCHQVIAREVAIKTAYRAIITPITELRTDPTELDNLTERRYQAGIFAGKKSASLAGAVIPDPTTALDPLVNAVIGSLLDHKREALEAFIDEYATHAPGAGPAVAGYKARPLNGVWATAPYLHNGSVPNLYELLLAEDQRSKAFVLGSRAFDPVRVGFALDQPKTAAAYTPTTFDVRERGNSNAGHAYLTRQDGVPFTDAERWQLVEYLKTL